MLIAYWVIVLCRVAKPGRAAGGGASKGGKGKAAAVAASEEISMDDLLPRADISGQISSTLLANLASTNWKERKEGLDEVEQIIASAGNRIQPDVSGQLGTAYPVLAVWHALFHLCYGEVLFLVLDISRLTITT